jgi:DNA-binding CsgD family transcriptional regulator
MQRPADVVPTGVDAQFDGGGLVFVHARRGEAALVLRYYGDFSEAEIATAMGISRGAVKSHTARGMSALKSILEQETS